MTCRREERIASTWLHQIETRSFQIRVVRFESLFSPCSHIHPSTSPTLGNNLSQIIQGGGCSSTTVVAIRGTTSKQTSSASNGPRIILTNSGWDYPLYVSYLLQRWYILTTYTRTCLDFPLRKALWRLLRTATRSIKTSRPMMVIGLENMEVLCFSSQVLS